MTGRLIDRCFVMRVAKTAIAAFQEKDALTFLLKVEQDGFLVACQNLCADGNFQNQISAAKSRSVASGAAFAVSGFVMLLETIIDQGVQIICGFEKYIAAFAAITAIRAAEFHIFFAMKADTAAPTRAAFEIDFREIEKFHNRTPRRKKANSMTVSFSSI